MPALRWSASPAAVRARGSLAGRLTKYRTNEAGLVAVDCYQSMQVARPAMAMATRPGR
ncbi:MAG: hypothetical protein KBF28_12720 [Gemmatimonadales bacterium]|nr:hypothetical protein [Gemmatimonadales bacterium]